MAAQERDASSSGDEESGSRGALWAPGVEEDGSEFFSALSSFNTVGALDIAGGMRSLAEDRLKRANADLKAGADASRRVQVLDGEGKPSWATFKDSITRDDNKEGLLRVPGGLMDGFIGAICFTVFWVIVAGKKHLPNAIELILRSEGYQLSQEAPVGRRTMRRRHCFKSRRPAPRLPRHSRQRRQVV